MQPSGGLPLTAVLLESCSQQTNISRIGGPGSRNGCGSDSDQSASTFIISRQNPPKPGQPPNPIKPKYVANPGLDARSCAPDTPAPSRAVHDAAC
jgi:hypothetical protein